MNTIPEYLLRPAERRRPHAPRRGFPWPLQLPLLPALASSST